MEAAGTEAESGGGLLGSEGVGGRTPVADAAEIAVVIPTLDEERCLPRLLDGLAAAEARGEARLEICVSDGGSRDGTVACAERAGARVVFGAAGRGTQLAAGAAAARAALIVFLHADTLPGPGALAALRDALGERDASAAGMRQRIEAPGRFYRCVERAANARVRRGMVYGDSGLAVRRSAYDAVGGFGTQPIFEDVDLTRRLRRYGRVELVEAAELLISARRWESEGKLRRTLMNWSLQAGYYLGVDPARLVRYYSGRRLSAPPAA